MIGGGPGKKAVSLSQLQEVEYIIHQMKSIICLYLLMYLILKIDINVKIVDKKLIF